MSLVQRITGAIGTLLLFSLFAAILTLQVRSERISTLAHLTRVSELVSHLSSLEQCLGNRHREITLLLQTVAGHDTATLDPAVNQAFRENLGTCRLGAERVVDHSANFQRALAANLAQLGDESKLLLADWLVVIDSLGTDYVAAIARQASEADPRAVRVLDEQIPRAREHSQRALVTARAQFEETAARADAYLLGFLLVSIVLLPLVAFLVTRRIVNGIRSLSSAMERYGAGELGFRVDVGGKDELSSFAGRINEMAARLRDNQETLVAQTTRLESSLDQLQAAQATLVQQEKLAALGGLVAGLAHEVNTPLGVAVTSGSLIEGHLEQLQHHTEQGTATRRILRETLGEMRAALTPLLGNLQRAAGLIQSFKQVSVDRNVVETREVTLPEFLNGLATTLSPLLKRSRCGLRLEVEGRRQLLVAAGELDQVITNLVVNACRHGYGDPVGDTALRPISLRAHLLDEHLHIEVEDEGAGMNPDILARVYEPFFSTRKGQGGTGLGMHIVHQLVTERFAGEIVVRTAPGEGTCWRLRLPLGTKALRYADAPRALAPAADDIAEPDSARSVRFVVYCAPYLGDAIDDDLRSIAEQSRRNNPRHGVTGTLLFDRGRFVQAIEGPPDRVTSLLERIRRDPRAGELDVVLDVLVPERSFSAWAMWTGQLSTGVTANNDELRAFRDAYLRAFRPSGAEFVALLQQAMRLGEPVG